MKTLCRQILIKLTPRGVRRLVSVAVSACALLVAVGTGASTANAATEPGYPTAQVEVGASARTLPYIESSDYWGYVLPNPGSSYWLQTASVECWVYGDWATGNYYGNKWFRVLVWESYDGYPVPRFLFVHGSYVFNQPSVGYCPPWTY
jgi:hypothetical protein